MAENMFYLSLDPYGDGTEPTATKGKLIAICEGWGECSLKCVIG